MNFLEVMRRLEEASSEQTRKIYEREGAGANVLGVKISDLQKLRKSIGKDHRLAGELWKSRNADAMMLATMIAEPNDQGRPALQRIENSIAASPNRVGYAMNNALIAIGIRNDSLPAKALGAAQRNGKVEVDHGETGCEAPDAAAYIAKALARRPAKTGA